MESQLDFSELIKEAENHISTLTPHVKSRFSAQLIIRLIDALKHFQENL